MTKHTRISALICAAFLAACGENPVQVITSSPAPTRIKFFNFGVNAPSVNFYVNSAKITAVLPSAAAPNAENTTGVSYGGVGAGGFYSGLDPGSYTIAPKIAATVDKDLAIATLTSTLETGKFYSYFMSGFYNTASKSVEGFIVEDPVPAAFDYSVAYVRFVNAISNSTPMTLYARNTTTTTEVAVGGSVAYKAAGTFTSIPVGIYDLNTRTAGSSANAITRTAVSFLAGRTYTIGARGDMTVLSTTATNRPFLDNTANR
jgi:hypothetical protein